MVSDAYLKYYTLLWEGEGGGGRGCRGDGGAGGGGRCMSVKYHMGMPYMTILVYQRAINLTFLHQI